MRPMILLLVITLLLTACTSPGPPVPEPTEEPGLSLRITWPTYGGRGQAVARTLEPFAHPVDLVGGDEDLEAITALIDSGYEGVLVLPYRYIQRLGAEGLLHNLSDPFAWDEALFYPQIWSLGTHGDQLFGIPWVTHSICLLYNADLLTRAGVDPETMASPETLLEAMESVEEKTGARGIGLVGADHHDLSWQFNMVLHGFGGRLLDPETSSVALDSPETLAALAYYRDGLGAHAPDDWTAHNGTDSLRLFREGRVAFTFQGPWGITDIEKNGSPFEVGILRPDQVGLTAEVGPMMLAMPAGLAPETVQHNNDLIDHLISIDAQLEIMKGEYIPEHDRTYLFRLPARRDLERHIYGDYRVYLPFMRASEQASIDVPTPAWQTIKETHYTPGLAAYMRGDTSAEDFLERITDDGNRYLKSRGQEEESP